MQYVAEQNARTEQISRLGLWQSWAILLMSLRMSRILSMSCPVQNIENSHKILSLMSCKMSLNCTEMAKISNIITGIPLTPLFTRPQTCYNQYRRVDFKNHLSTQTGNTFWGIFFPILCLELNWKQNYILLELHSLQQHGSVDFNANRWISEVTRPLDEYFQLLEGNPCIFDINGEISYLAITIT